MKAHQSKRRTLGGSSGAARDVHNDWSCEYTPLPSSFQRSITAFLDRPTCMDVARQIDGALLSAKFSTVPVNQWRVIGDER